MDDFKLKTTKLEAIEGMGPDPRTKATSSRLENSEPPRTSALDPIVVTRKLQLASDLFEMCFKTKQFQIKKRFPQLSHKEVIQEAYRLIEKGCQ